MVVWLCELCRKIDGQLQLRVISDLQQTEILGTTYDDAFALVQKVRTFINPRPLQIARLKELEQFYKDKANT